MANEAICRLATQVRDEFRIFSCRYKPPEWDFTLQPFLKARICLNFSREVRGIVDEILCDGIDLDVLVGNLNSHGLNIGKLGSSGRAISRSSAHAA